VPFSLWVAMHLDRPLGPASGQNGPASGPKAAGGEIPRARFLAELRQLGAIVRPEAVFFYMCHIRSKAAPGFPRFQGPLSSEYGTHRQSRPDYGIGFQATF